tara:strand:+ start:1389 stop:1535 length:147 start_codon:yes stop_codon:yes gene_type:complete
MKKYLVLLDKEDVPVWDAFKKVYKKRGFGSNLNQAIINLMRGELKHGK